MELTAIAFFPSVQAKRLRITGWKSWNHSWLLYFFHLTIQSIHEQILSVLPSNICNLFTLHQSHHPALSHHHSHLGYGNNLLIVLSVSTSYSHSLNSHSVILTWHKSDQVSPLFYSQSSSDFRLRVFPMAYQLSYNGMTSSPNILTLALLQLNYLLYCF